MKLEQFRLALESEATKQNDQLNKKIAELNKIIEMKDEQIVELKKRFKIMCNRCFAQTQGMLCVFCGYKDDCDCRFE